MGFWVHTNSPQTLLISKQDLKKKIDGVCKKDKKVLNFPQMEKWGFLCFWFYEGGNWECKNRREEMGFINRLFGKGIRNNLEDTPKVHFFWDNLSEAYPKFQCLRPHPLFNSNPFHIHFYI